MSWSSRRAVLVLTAVAVLGSSFALHYSSAQPLRPPRRPPGPPVGAPPLPPPSPKAPEGFDLGSLSLPNNPELNDEIQLAIDHIRASVPDYDIATETIHKILQR